MWSCVVFVTPRFNAKDAVYYSTPLLVFYAIVLLLMQYLYNLDLTEEELESSIYAGLARYHGPPPGARVLTIALKVVFYIPYMLLCGSNILGIKIFYLEYCIAVKSSLLSDQY